MINFLTDEQKEKYKEYLDFARINITPYVNNWEREQAIPRDVINLCAQTGYLGGMAPGEYGGLGWDTTTYGLFNEVIGNASISLGGLFNVHTMIMQTLLKWGSEEQKAKWLPSMAKGKIIGAFALTETVAGSDIKGIITQYSDNGDHVLLNGKKSWITFGGVANIYLVFGKLDDKPTVYIVERETEGFKIIPIKDMLGFKASHLAVLEFNNCKVNRENIIGKPGFAFTHIAPFALEFGRVSVAFGALGLLRSCMEICSSHVISRKAFGKRLIDYSTIGSMIADMGVDIEAARLLCINACKAKDEHNPDATEKIMMAKYFVTRAASKHSINAVQIMGALGCNEEYVVARHYRDSKTMEIIEGSTQILQMLLGRSFARKYRTKKL